MPGCLTASVPQRVKQVRARRKRVRLRGEGEAFRTFARQAGYRSDNALSLAIGLNRSTVTRVCDGDLHPGACFVAGVLSVFDTVLFHVLFEIIDD
ncbi:hypothetical protein GCM10022243_22050 [Saccharothrix violaceirubra]